MFASGYFWTLQEDCIIVSDSCWAAYSSQARLLTGHVVYCLQNPATQVLSKVTCACAVVAGSGIQVFAWPVPERLATVAWLCIDTLPRDVASIAYIQSTAVVHAADPCVHGLRMLCLCKRAHIRRAVTEVACTRYSGLVPWGLWCVDKGDVGWCVWHVVTAWLCVHHSWRAWQHQHIVHCWKRAPSTQPQAPRAACGMTRYIGSQAGTAFDPKTCRACALGGRCYQVIAGSTCEGYAGGLRSDLCSVFCCCCWHIAAAAVHVCLMH